MYAKQNSNGKEEEETGFICSFEMNDALNERLNELNASIAMLNSRVTALHVLVRRTRTCSAFTMEEHDALDAELSKEEHDLQLKQDELARTREFFDNTATRFDSDLRDRENILNEVFEREELSEHQDLMNFFADHHAFLRETITQVFPE
jgi:hypothetical protein